MIIKRVGPVFVLAFTSALTAEFLLGDQYLGKQGVGEQLGALLLFTAFYGGAAVLIRELVRRRGLGWPSLLCLALGFGVLEEGVLTQSLFNPDYVGQHLIAPGYIPGLGIGSEWTIFVLTLHVVWSIVTPIALVEANAGTAPRLRRPGLVVAAVSFLLGAVATFALNLAMSPVHFVASPYRLANAFVLSVVLVAVGLRLTGRPTAPKTASGPVVAAAVVGLVTTTAFQLGRRIDHPAWLVCLAMLVPLLVGAMLAVRFRLPAGGLAIGAALTYCWVGLSTAADAGRSQTLEQAVIVAAYLVVLAVTWVRTVRAPREEDAAASTRPEPPRGPDQPVGSTASEGR